MSSLGDNPVSRVVGNLPHVKMSDRALAVQRNVAGLALLESREAELAAQFGQGSERYYREMQSTIDSVNHLRGYSGSKFAKGLGVLNALTSPQQMISRLQVIGDPINMLLRGDTASAKFAAETLMGFASSQTALMAFLKITGDQAGGRWSVNANPLDGDFGQLQIGNSRYDTLAGLGPIIKTGARIAAVTSDAAFDTEFAKNHANVKDLVEQWITNKETPTARLFYDMAKDMKLPDVETLAGLVAPSIAMGIMQDIRENRGANKLLAVPNAAANFIGVGTNTYKNAEDLTNETSVDVTGQKFSEIKDPVERLKVIAQLPADATKGQNNPKAAERQAYEALLKQKGVIEAPPKKEDGTPGETDSEAKKRRAANADVIATLNPDEQVQRWYWEGSDTLPSKDAVDKALGLGVPNRKVKLDQTQRDLTTEQGKAFWQNNGKSIAPYFDDAFVAKTNKALADYYGMRSAEKLPFDQLPLDKQSTVAGQVRQAVREQDPGLDALLAYIGTGGSGSVANGNRRFTVHSEAAAEQLAKLRAKYGSGAAEEGAKFYKPDPTKKVGSVPVDVEKARAAGTR